MQYCEVCMIGVVQTQVRIRILSAGLTLQDWYDKSNLRESAFV